MSEGYRYLIVRIKNEPKRYTNKTNFAAVRGALHDFSEISGIALADLGTDFSGMETKERRVVERAFENTLERAKARRTNGKQ